MDRARWRKLIGMIDDYDESSGWMFLLVPAHPGFPGQIPQRAVKRLCVCVCCFTTQSNEFGTDFTGWTKKVWLSLSSAICPD